MTNHECSECGCECAAAVQEINRLQTAEQLLFQLGEAIETYSNDQFKEWPEYQASVAHFTGRAA